MTTEQTVDKVLDGIDAAKMREQLIETIKKLVALHEISYAIGGNNIEGVANELLKQFIITTRS